MRAHLTKSEPAAYFSVSPRTIENWIARGILVAHWIGGRVIIFEEDLDAAIQKIDANGEDK